MPLDHKGHPLAEAAATPETPVTPTLDAVFWDLDGTLIDSEPHWNAAHRALLEADGGTWTEELAHALVGQSLDHGARLLQQAGVRLSEQEIIDRSLQAVIEAIRGDLPWRPGARELLTALSDAGVPCALVTMSHTPLAQVVMESVPAGSLEFMVTGDQVTHGKPHPEPYLTALNTMQSRHEGVDRRRCAVIEDSLPGVTSATAAGIPTIAVPLITELPVDQRRQLWPSLQSRSVTDLAEAVHQLAPYVGAHAVSAAADWQGA